MKLIQLILKTILVTLTVIFTILALSFGAAIWQANAAMDECTTSDGNVNSTCVMENL